jgi:transposase
MNNNTHSVSFVSVAPSKPVLKIGIDAHALQYVIVTQVDGSAPKPAQRFDQAGLIRWLGKKLQEGFAVVSCYEAGALGYVLHRKLTELGVTNYVIRPRHWDDQSKRVKTDRSDARSILSALDRFLAGNTRVLTVVRVPDLDQERRRSQSRIRESLQRQLKAAAQRGRGLALQYGYRLRGQWYGPRRWPRLELPAWLRQLLEPLREVALFLWGKLGQQTQAVEQASLGPKPTGVGSLTEQILEREIGDWHRFKNRRQVSSYLGLCPSEHSSGGRQRQAGITKAGNPRLRQTLCQAAWRLLKYQTHYWLVKKWQPQLLASGVTARRRKQIIVAIAPRLCGGLVAPAHRPNHRR